MASSEPDTPAAIDPPMVRLRGVRKSFEDLVVLDGLDLDVAKGEKLVIIGPSGSGKTTILRVVMTLERPDDGTVEIDGRHLYHVWRDGERRRAPEKHVRSVRRDISMVFQHFNLFPHKTALANIALGPVQALGMPKADARERARELLARVGLTGKEDQYPAQLSGGQKQRVAIARALAMEPKVMLFDEVTSALDPELVGEVLGVLRDIAVHTEMTMLLVTHEMGFARDIADRVVMFDAGRVVEQGPPRDLLASPQEARTQDFLRAVVGRG